MRRALPALALTAMLLSACGPLGEDPAPEDSSSAPSQAETTEGPPSATGLWVLVSAEGGIGEATIKDNPDEVPAFRQSIEGREWVEVETLYSISISREDEDTTVRCEVWQDGVKHAEDESYAATEAANGKGFASCP